MKLSFKSFTRNLTVATFATATLLPVASASAQSLNGAGATFPYPLYSKWFASYNGARINYQPIGSGAGITALKSQTVDFAGSDAPLSNAERRGMPGDVVHLPMTAGAVAVVYNLPGAPRGLKMNGPIIANIFLGQITRWNDARIAAANPGVRLPNKSITVAHRSDGSGTTNIFTNYLSAVSPSWKSQVGAGKAVAWPIGQGGKGNDGVAAIVKGQSGGIGYVELAYAARNGLAYGAVQNRSGAFVLPSVVGVQAAAASASKAISRDVRASIVNQPGARAYPISGFSYILVYERNRDAGKTRALKNFLAWANTRGQTYATSLLYAPLPRSVQALNAQKLRNIK